MAEREPSIPEALTTPRGTRHKLGARYRFYQGKSITFEMPDEMLKVLNELMDQTDHQLEEIFFKSLLLYKAAVDAEQDGKTMVILDADGDIDQEITGL